jgi:hypothetical protein
MGATLDMLRSYAVYGSGLALLRWQYDWQCCAPREQRIPYGKADRTVYKVQREAEIFELAPPT